MIRTQGLPKEVHFSFTNIEENGSDVKVQLKEYVKYICTRQPRSRMVWGHFCQGSVCDVVCDVVHDGAVKRGPR